MGLAVVLRGHARVRARWLDCSQWMQELEVWRHKLSDLLCLH